MTNLLPEATQKKIRNEYQARFILAGSGLAVVAAFFTMLILSPSIGVLLITRPEAIARATQVQQGKQDISDIGNAQALVVALAPVAVASSSPSSAIIAVLSHRPPGIHIESMGMNATTISLAGTGETRDLIDKFRTALESDDRFTSVKLPISDLVGSKGGKFTITLTGKF